MAELITSAAASQIARVAADAVTTLGKAGALAFAQAGCDKDVLGRLQGALRSLKPLQQYASALAHAAPLRGTFNSQFLSNILAPSVPTTQVSQPPSP